MSGANWGAAGSPEINWRMSASLRDVPRGDEDVPEVTSLEGVVRAWLALDPAHRGKAILTPEHPVLIDGASMSEFSGEGIAALAARLPGAAQANDAEPEDEAG